MDTKHISIVIVLLVMVGIGAFYGGIEYGRGRAGEPGAVRFGNQFSNLSPEERQARISQGGGRQMVRNGNGFVGGSIIAQDTESITVKLPEGGSKIIFLGEGTVIVKNTPGAREDLAIGQEVVATGKPNPDGSLNAEHVQLRPAPAPSAGN